jgi:uncharacterized protein YciI
MSFWRLSIVVCLTGGNRRTEFRRKTRKIAVKIRTAFLIIAFAAVGSIATNKVVSAGNQQSAKRYAYVLRAKNPEFAHNGPRPEDARTVQAHVKYLKGLMEKGVCVVAGHTLNQDETGFGIAVVNADSEISAQDIMEHDPLVQAGILQGTVFPFEIAIGSASASH